MHFERAVSLAPGQYFLVGGAEYLGTVDGSFDDSGNSDGVELYDTGLAVVIDDVDVGDAPPALMKIDGQLDESYQRWFGGCQDTDVWLADFFHTGAPTPSTTIDPLAPC